MAGPGHRRRVLLQEALRRLFTAGERRVGLGVDGDNAAAIRLYERAGMRVAWAAVRYERAVGEARADTGGRSSARVRH